MSGLIALSLLVVALVLPARLRSILSSFGLEWVLRRHRMLGLVVMGLIVLHLLFVVIGDPRGLGALNLAHAHRPMWAATTATVTLLVLVASAARRRTRQPRYEGWRMLHVGLAGIVLVAAGLHVWWLHLLVNSPALRTWFVLLFAFAFAVLVQRWIWRPMRTRRRAYLVEDVRPESRNAVTVTLRAEGHDGVPFQAGQFAWIKFGRSPFVFEDHPFTISSSASRSDRMEFTVKALGDFSKLITRLPPGQHLFLDGPYGRFTVDGLRSSGFVFIAGGVGVTPIMSILRTLADGGDRRRHLLVFGARTISDLLLRADIAALQRLLDLRVVEVLQTPPPQWTGQCGRIDSTLLDRCLPRLARHYDYFVSGPPAMVVAVGRDLRRRHIPPRRIHTERFEVV